MAGAGMASIRAPLMTPHLRPFAIHWPPNSALGRRLALEMSYYLMLKNWSFFSYYFLCLFGL
jgi:hypothetical protein